MSRRAGPAILAVLSHLALWPGLYVLAAFFCFIQLAGGPPTPDPAALARAALYAFLTATGTYLFDRVKLADRWLDPADRVAHPARYEFLARRAPFIRILAAALIIAGLAALLSLATLALSLAACVGIVLYAGRPRRRRPRLKDRIIVKNAFVATGITGFAAVLAVLLITPAALTKHDLPLWLFSAAHLFIRVWADAALCDLDDEHADRAFGTDTLATHLGRTKAWNTAMALRLGLAFALVLIPIGPFPARAAWAIVTAFSSIALRLARPPAMRDWVDARFPLEALAAWFLAGLMA